MARPRGHKNNAEQNANLDRGRANAAKSNAARNAERRAKRGRGELPDKSRHQMLLDGELSVEELDELECQRFRGRDIDGEFKGRIRPLPPAIYNAIRDRLIREMNEGFQAFLPRAQAILESIAESSEHDAVRVKAVDIILQRGAGKVPDIVRVGTEDPWDAVLRDELARIDGDVADRAKDRLNRMNQGAEQDG